jgi:hypothetical protein
MRPSFASLINLLKFTEDADLPNPELYEIKLFGKNLRIKLGTLLTTPSTNVWVSFYNGKGIMSIVDDNDDLVAFRDIKDNRALEWVQSLTPKELETYMRYVLMEKHVIRVKPAPYNFRDVLEYLCYTAPWRFSRKERETFF